LYHIIEEVRLVLIEKVMVGPFMENAYVVGCEDTGHAVLVDPGDEADRIADVVDRLGLTVDKIINTHSHIDHIAAVEELRQRFGVPFCLHKAEEPFLEMLPELGALFGIQFPKEAIPRVDEFLEDDSEVTFGNVTLKVLWVPGHSPGHVAFVDKEEIFAGDVLFQGSIGRTDLPGGNYDTLMSSIKEKFLVLNDEVRVHSGHGPATTIGVERKQNPFLRDL